MLKMVSESFIYALLLFLGLFLNISCWVPLHGGKFDSAAILESGGPGNEWYKRSAVLKNTQ